MKHFSTGAIFSVFTIALISSFCLATDAGAAEKTLSRTEDFVVVTGADVPELLGSEIADIRLYSCSGGPCVPVPVQVDKVDSTGRYVFPEEINRDRDGSKLDENDEMAFMAEDAGTTCPSGWKPEGAKGKGVKIVLVDPVDGGKGTLYLFNMPGTSVPDVPDYVSYRIEGENTIIESQQFIMGYKSDRISYDRIQLMSSSGEMGPDILDRQRVGMEAHMAGGGSLPVVAPESIVKASDIGVIDGPVRVILDQVVLVEIGAISLKWGTEYFIKYYRCGQNNSVFYEFPMGPNQLFKTILFYWSLDFTPDVIGSYYIDPNRDEPVPITEENREGVPDDASHFWWGMYGPQGALYQALDLDDDMHPYFTCDGRWRQDPRAKIRDGDYPGRLEIGFNCHEVGDIPEETEYHWFNYILFPSQPSAEGVEELRAMVEDPLEVKISAVP